eukprot:2100377-Prymnesium_polylepis.1
MLRRDRTSRVELVSTRAQLKVRSEGKNGPHPFVDSECERAVRTGASTWQSVQTWCTALWRTSRLSS